MKICPMCNSRGFSEETPKVCFYCDFVEKPNSELTEEEINGLLAPYEYEKVEDGYRIKSVKNIRDTTFRGNVGVPPIVTEIAPGALSCLKFMSVLEFPEGLREIGTEAVGGCRDLCYVYIPKTVKVMGKGIFRDCYDLGTVDCGAEAQPEGWDPDWLDGCNAKAEFGVPEIDL